MTVGDAGWATIGDPGRVLSASYSYFCFFKVRSSKDERRHSMTEKKKRVDDVLT
jgi:hypothetical protein